MKWEYKIVHLNGGGYFGDAETPTEAGLNELGQDGWELAASLDSSGIKLGGRGGSTTGLVFKRPVEGGDPRSRETSHSGQ
jgi:hypothetical protein